METGGIVVGDDKKFEKYISNLRKPSLDRENSKYYEEIQRLAYELVKFLRMNEDKNEHNNQGNWNLTYLIENMKPKDFKYVTTSFMKRIPLNELKEMIEENFTEHSVVYLNAETGDSEGVLLIEKNEVDKYLRNKTFLHVGFGLLAGLIVGFGTVLFFN